MPTPQDQDLLDLVRRKAPNAFEALYQAYYGRLRATTIHFLGHDDPEGEDLVQETFTVALAKLPKVKIQTNLYGWLNRVCTLLCFERLRFRKRLLITEDAGLLDIMSQRGRDAAALSEEGLEKDEQGQMLRAALAGLKEPCRQILELRDIKGVSYAEISKLLKLPMGTVMSRLLRCRQLLKQKVQRTALRGAR
jgi:RNA polymerase sigma-70 factor (ECF subfamily)